MNNNIIKRALKAKKLTLKWLAKRMKCNYAHLCVKIKDDNLTLKEINSILSLLQLKTILVLLDEENNVM